MRVLTIDSEAVPVSRTPKRKTASDRRRDARRVQKKIEDRVTERAGLWAAGNGRDGYTVARQDGVPSPVKGPDAYLHKETPGSLAGLHVEKRVEMHGARLGSKEL